MQENIHVALLEAADRPSEAPRLLTLLHCAKALQELGEALPSLTNEVEWNRTHQLIDRMYTHWFATGRAIKSFPQFAHLVRFTPLHNCNGFGDATFLLKLITSWSESLRVGTSIFSDGYDLVRYRNRLGMVYKVYGRIGVPRDDFNDSGVRLRGVVLATLSSDGVVDEATQTHYTLNKDVLREINLLRSRGSIFMELGPVTFNEAEEVDHSARHRRVCTVNHERIAAVATNVRLDFSGPENEISTPECPYVVRVIADIEASGPLGELFEDLVRIHGRTGVRFCLRGVVKRVPKEGIMYSEVINLTSFDVLPPRIESHESSNTGGV